MAKIALKTAHKVVPIIYAYTTPEIRKHDGWTKIGYSEQNAETRIKQQTHTADIEFKLEWSKNAVFDDGSGEIFHDTDFHSYLTKNDVERTSGTEWFHITPVPAKHMLDDFRENHGVLSQITNVIPYELRPEQKEADERAKDYFQLHEKAEFLFNCKPRFGKTLAVYDLCKQMRLQNVLIVTNRPAIANSWYEDYSKFFGIESGYQFVSEVDALKGKKNVLSRDEYSKMNSACDNPYKCIEFVSLQDMKGSKYFRQNGIDKLRDVSELNWDILVIDEAHEGIDTYKTDVAFDHVKRKYTLHLSGTPFKALANDKFSDDAIYNWTYADEQKAKENWNADDGEVNPYINLPKLNMYTYQMSEIIHDKLKQGIEINDETEEYAFDLNEFFETNNSGSFIHNTDVNQFIDALTTQTKFPFSTDELRNELKHTLWLLNRVDSAKALAKKLEQHPVFGKYKIILAAGDGRLSDDEEMVKSFDKVKDAISKYDKTITLSVGQLTTGVTIPEWSGVLMLSNIKSPALYMQAAFRAQNPCLYSNGKEFFRKENAYVFDFDPARTLTIFEEFANDLSSATSSGKGDTGTRKDNVRELLNFFPVIGEDKDGEMIELDAEQVLSIPRKIKSQEVVKRGFMSNFLFQNISNVFHAPQAVIDAIKAMAPAKESDSFSKLNNSAEDELSLDENGDINLSNDYVIGTAEDVFGDKIFDTSAAEIDDALDRLSAADKKTGEESYLDMLKDKFCTEITDKVLNTASEKYGSDMSDKSKTALNRKINSDASSLINHAYDDMKIKTNVLENDRKQKLDEVLTKEDEDIVNDNFDKQKQAITEEFTSHISESVKTFIEQAEQDAIRTVETDKREQTKRSIEDSIRDHLRGFSRTIPSFLMAYGENDTTLENFDAIIPDSVFKEVTSISLDQFRFLRDGGAYTNDETGKEDFFAGQIFDPVVFNDSVKEFLALKVKLSDYFDNSNHEDIFDYIPPQKTNQIFTPRKIVKEMVDDLEIENPGCFDNPDKSFADLYMKSGMYITEIVKRLYNSEHMKSMYPDDAKRLNHIFEKQVYGLAPTEIIYRICLSYILGFSDEIKIEKHNIKLCDTLEYVKNSTLEMKLEELFPELVDNLAAAHS